MKENDIRFARLLLIVNGAVPLVLLGWDALHHQLGANPVKFTLLTTGMMGLIFLLLTLLVTPLRKISGWNWIIFSRRTLGLYAFFYACLHFLIFFGLDRSFNVSSTLTEMVKRKYLIIGSTGLLVMVPLARVAPAGLCGGHCGSDPLLPASEGGCPAAAGARGSVDRFARLPRAGILAPAQTWTGCRCQSRPPNLVWPQPRFHRKPISQALCRIQELTIMIQRFSAKRGWLREIYQLVGIIQTPIPNK